MACGDARSIVTCEHCRFKYDCKSSDVTKKEESLSPEKLELTEKTNTELYWVSMIIQETENSKPWLCAITDGCLSLEDAKKSIEKGRINFRVLSAWVDTFDNNNTKTTVFHECYIN